MKIIYRLYYFIIHVLTAKHTKGFGVHSPYMYNFIRYVILEKNAFYKFDKIEKIRYNLLNNNAVIETLDFGTGQHRKRSVSDIAQKSLIKPKYGKLIFRTINYLKLYNQLELGTSLGISAAYMASASDKCKCVTIEGCVNTIDIAHSTFEKLNLKNIEIIDGNIDIMLPLALQKLSKVDFVYIDANHTQQATMRYFNAIAPHLSENAVVIIDDIHWSKEMKNAWENIKNHYIVKSSIDLYRMGMLFTNPDLHKKHYKMNF